MLAGQSAWLPYGCTSVGHLLWRHERLRHLGRCTFRDASRRHSLYPMRSIFILTLDAPSCLPRGA